jgi:tetratricopeptide (TPR) repeat protein
MQKIASFLISSPLKAAALWIKKAIMVFHGKELIAGADPGALMTKTVLIRIGVFFTLFINIAALAGVFICRRDRRYIHFYILFASIWLIQIITVCSGRYRIAMLPAVLVFASGAIMFLIQNFRRHTILSLLAIAVTASLSVISVKGFSQENAAEAASVYGEAFFRMGDFENAKKYLADAEREIDDTLRFAVFAGAMAEFEQNFAAAESHYRRAVASDSNEIQGLMNLASLVGRDPSRKNEAQKYFAEAFKLNSNSALLYYNYSCFKKNYGEDFMDYLLKAIELDKQLAEAWNMLGVCAFEAGNASGALICFTNAAEAAKMNPGFWNNMRIAAISVGNHADALRAEKMLNKITARQ